MASASLVFALDQPALRLNILRADLLVTLKKLEHHAFANKMHVWRFTHESFMELNDLLASEAIVPLLKASSKKQVIQELSERAAKLTGLPQRQIFDKLLQRERLGSTGVGQGVAIPHGKLAELDKIHGIFAVLDKPVNYDAMDDKPVDIVFLLLAPEGAGADHLKALARIARVLRNDGALAKLRSATDADAIRAILCELQESNAA